MWYPTTEQINEKEEKDGAIQIGHFRSCAAVFRFCIVLCFFLLCANIVFIEYRGDSLATFYTPCLLCIGFYWEGLGWDHANLSSTYKC